MFLLPTVGTEEGPSDRHIIPGRIYGETGPCHGEPGHFPLLRRIHTMTFRMPLAPARIAIPIARTGEVQYAALLERGTFTGWKGDPS
jgi:hypothetical protein